MPTKFIDNWSSVVCFWVFTAISLSSSCFAYTYSPQSSFGNHSPSFFVGVGGFIPFSGRLSNSSSGSTSLTSPFLPTLSLAGNFRLPLNFKLSPIIAYTVFGHKSQDGGETSRYIPLAVRLEKRAGPVNARLGPGVLFYTVSGSGGTSVQNNGASTSTYAFPSTSNTARLFFWDLGAGTSYGRFRIDLDSLITGTFSSRRAVNWLVTLSYGLF